MNLSKIQNTFLTALVVLSAFLAVAVSGTFAQTVNAQPSDIPYGCPGGPPGPPAPGTVCPDEGQSGDGQIEEPYYVSSDCQETTVDSENCGIIGYLVIFINILSVVAGVVIVGSIIWAGIQYSSAGSDPQKVSASKSRIRNAIIALLLFIFGYSFLNYLIPGGLL